MILYFSGSGNSLAIARQLAEKLDEHVMSFVKNCYFCLFNFGGDADSKTTDLCRSLSHGGGFLPCRDDYVRQRLHNCGTEIIRGECHHQLCGDTNWQPRTAD